MDSTFYDSNYYENGIASKKSLYTNYRWLKNETNDLKDNLIKYLNIENNMSILDYGCAKGYLVYAFRTSGYSAYGVDISSYAISQCFEEIKGNMKCIDSVEDIPLEWGYFDFCIAKDTLEHLEIVSLEKTLSELSKRCNKLFVIIPLGDGQKYLDIEQEQDVSHIIKEPLEWWIKKFVNFGWSVVETSTHMPSMKPRYIDKPGTQGFFLLQTINNVVGLHLT